MRKWLLILAVGLWGSLALADPSDGGVALGGSWNLEERKAVVRFVDADGGWDGLIDSSPRGAEVGFLLFRQLRQVSAKELRGTLAMPENGSTHEVVVTVEGEHLKAVVGKWIFSKTLELKRVVVKPAGAP
jgi:hypothetical protein